MDNQSGIYIYFDKNCNLHIHRNRNGNRSDDSQSGLEIILNISKFNKKTWNLISTFKVFCVHSVSIDMWTYHCHLKWFVEYCNELEIGLDDETAGIWRLNLATVCYVIIIFLKKFLLYFKVQKHGKILPQPIL